MIILGIDPGTLVTGYGILDVTSKRMKMLECGAVRNHTSRSMPIRLRTIYDGLTKVIEKYHPDECAIETAFYGKNAQSALKIGQARGVAILAAVQWEIPTSEYAPRQVKQTVTGKGSASKQQVQFMVKKLLTLKRVPKELDASDAVAVALCHIERRKPRILRPSSRKSGWSEFVHRNPERILPPR